MFHMRPRFLFLLKSLSRPGLGSLAAPALALLISPALTACAFFSTPDPAPRPLTPLVVYLVSAKPGDSTTLDDPMFGENVRVTADDTFTSAAGEECRRGTVLSSGKEAEVVAVCRGGVTGDWKLAPRVWGQGIDRP